jgi:hypothetical protein
MYIAHGNAVSMATPITPLGLQAACSSQVVVDRIRGLST